MAEGRWRVAHAASEGLSRFLSMRRAWFCMVCVVAPLCWFAKLGIVHEAALIGGLTAMMGGFFATHGAADWASRRYGSQASYGPPAPMPLPPPPPPSPPEGS